MSSGVLCTFPGKIGDILWSLATAREISRMHGQRVDFYTMPYYESLKPLLEAQEYIATAGVVKDWLRTHSNYGDQPWKPPEEVEKKGHLKIISPEKNGGVFGYVVEPYEHVYHLGYRRPPGVPVPQPLIDYIAWQKHMQLREPVVPFISCLGILPEKLGMGGKEWAAGAFNEQFEEVKREFWEELQAQTKEIEWVDVTKKPWLEAAWIIKHAKIFVGCRSSNWVLAMAMGQETITFEPNIDRHGASQSGRMFGCPYGKEMRLPLGMPVKLLAGIAAQLVGRRMGRKVECTQ